MCTGICTSKLLLPTMAFSYKDIMVPDKCNFKIHLAKVNFKKRFLAKVQCFCFLFFFVNDDETFVIEFTTSRF